MKVETYRTNEPGPVPATHCTMHTLITGADIFLVMIPWNICHHITSHHINIIQHYFSFLYKSIVRNYLYQNDFQLTNKLVSKE
jgi:hypothetical protein